MPDNTAGLRRADNALPGAIVCPGAGERDTSKILIKGSHPGTDPLSDGGRLAV